MDPIEIAVMALGQMATFRGAPVRDEVVLLFAKRLIAEGQTPEQIIDACGDLERRPRSEGETAWPSLGTLLEECRRSALRLAARRCVELARMAPKALSAPEWQDMTPEDAQAFVARLRRDVQDVRKGRYLRVVGE